MKRYLSAARVAELAELLEESPMRVGVVDEILQAAAEHRGLTLVLRDDNRVTSPLGGNREADRHRGTR